MPRQKGENCCGKLVVAVANNHMPGAADIGIFGMRHEREKLACVRLLNKLR